MRWINVERPLDVVLMQPTGAYMSGWFVLRTGEDIIFANPRAMYVGSMYKIRVDSRINYIFPTRFSMQWYMH